MSITILATKFHIPSRRAGLVARPRLLEGLQRGLEENRELTLVSAPAGYGKTTLVAEWIANLQSSTNKQKPKTSWLSLDEADNNPVRFARYFLAAFQQADEALGAQAQGMLEMPGRPPLPSLFDILLNDLAEVDAPHVLVLDDYHIISSPEIHAALEYFLNHQPACVHLVLTTRADPPLPLARLRARRQMTEIRARDLRFTDDEARTFFGLANLTLAENALRTLEERTEGWVAGLHLAALALQNQPDPETFIRTFQGSHRYVLDYLAGEILQQQEEELRAFLTQTSLLARFNAGLCNTLTGPDDSQSLIARLEQSNLFIIPLDDERIWYRYHHLFADYLHSLLSKPEQAALYQKAAIWHEANDLTVEAVRYALSSGDGHFAAQIIENALGKNSTWSDGNLAQLVAWLEALPDEAFHSRPCLGLHATRAFYVQGRFERAEAHLAQAEQFLQTLPAIPETGELLAIATLNRGAIAAVRGDFQQVLALVPAAQARIPRESHLWHARANFSLGLAYEIAKQTEKAAEYYLQSSSEAHAAGVLFLEMHGLCCAAQVQINQGHLNQAARTCQNAIQLAKGARLPPLGMVWNILGAIALERNDLLSAEKYLRDGIALSRQGGLRDDLSVGLVSLARLRIYQGDLAGMQAVMDEVLPLIHAIGMPRTEQLARVFIARFRHFLDQAEAPTRWASEYQFVRAEPLTEFEELALARVMISRVELEMALGILHPLLEKSRFYAAIGLFEPGCNPAPSCAISIVTPLN